MLRGTKLPANRPAATILGSTRASRADRDHSPGNAYRATKFGQFEQRVQDAAPLRHASVDERENEPINDIRADDLPRREGFTQVESCLVHPLDRSPRAATRQAIVAVANPSRRRPMPE